MRFAFACVILLASHGTALADGFQSPSGNIACAFFSGVTCEIAEISKQSPGLPPRPADCQLDYGNSFTLGQTGKTSLDCAGDTIRDPSFSTLAYGKSVTRGGITCTSEKTGVTCRNSSGHGFTLSKTAQKLF